MKATTFFLVGAAGRQMCLYWMHGKESRIGPYCDEWGKLQGSVVVYGRWESMSSTDHSRTVR